MWDIGFVEAIGMAGRAMLAISTCWFIWKAGRGKDIENYEAFVYGLLMGVILKG